MNPWEEDWTGASQRMPWEEDWETESAAAPARPRFIPKDADGIPLPTTAFDVVQTDPLGLRSLRSAAGLPDATGGLYGGPKKLPATGDIFNKPMISSADDIRNMKFDRLDTPRAMQADKMSREQSLALGINDFNPVRLATGDRGYEKALTESVQDNPVTTRIGQATALTAGGSAQLINRAILAAPKLVPAAVAARVAAQSVPARLARYGGRLATLAGVGAADYAVYNAAAEAPNVARETGAELPTTGERAGFAAERLGDPAGWAPLPALSLAYRLGRGGVTAAKNTTQATLAANKSAPRPEVVAAGVPSLPPIQWRGGSFTPADVQARVAMGGIDPATNSSVREIAIDKLLKEGFNPDEAEKAVRLMSYNGYSNVDEMLFEIDNNLAELATAVGRVNRPGQQVLRDEFKARREAMPEEIRTALRQAVGASGDDLETFALKMTEQATEASADGYKAAYGKTISDDAWQRLLGLFGETPDAVDAARKGAELARNSARRDPAKLEAARQLDELAGVLGSGGVPNAKLSTMALDFLDRGLGRKVSIATGQNDTAYSASLLDFRNALRGSGLDAETGLNVPRTIYAQYKAAQKAVEFGEKSFGKSTSLKDMKAQFAAAMKQADEAAEDGIGEGSSIIDNALMMGWVRGAENAIDMAENPATLIRQLYGSQRQREKLVSMLRELPDEAPAGIKADTTKRKKALVGSVSPDYEFDFGLSTGERAKGTTSVRSLFDRQRDMIESERRTVGGSPTAGAADAIANQGGDQRRLAGALDMLRAPQEIPWKIAAAVAERITQPMIYNPAVSRELGELLATRGKDRLLAVIDEIRQRQAATGRGPKPPAPSIPPPASPIRAGGFAGFGGKKPPQSPPPAAPSRRPRNDRFETLRLLVQRQNPGVADDQIDALTEQEYRAFYGRPAPGVKVTEKDYADGWERAVSEAKDQLDATAGPGNYTAADLEREAIEGFTGVYSGRGLPEDTMALPLTLAKDGDRTLPGKRIYVFEVNGKAFTGATPEEAARRAGDLSPAMGNVSENKPTVRKYAIEEDGTQVPYDEAIRSRPKAPPSSPESEFARLVTAEQRLNAPARELSEGDLLRLAEPYARAYLAKGGQGASDIERAAYEVVQRMGGGTKSSGLPGLRTDIGAGVGGAMFTSAMPMEEDATLEDKLARAGTGFLLGYGGSKGGRIGARMAGQRTVGKTATAGVPGGSAPRKPTVGKPKRDIGTKVADASAIAALSLAPPAQAQGSDGAAELDAAKQRVTDIQTRAIPELEDQLRVLRDPKGDPFAKQEILKLRGYPLGTTGPRGDGVDGVIGQRTTQAIVDEAKKVERDIEQRRKDLEKAQAGVTQLEMRMAQAAAEGNSAGSAFGKVAPWVGAAAGLYLGFRSRNGAVRKSAQVARAAAQRADALVNSKPVSRGINSPDGVNTRAANLNEFWRLGGAGENVPFKTDTKGNWRSRAKATEPSQLYSRTPPRLKSEDYGVMASGLGESALATAGVESAKKQIEEAKAEVEKYAAAGDVAGMQRALERQKQAEQLLVAAEVFQRLGLAIAGGRAVGALKTPYAAVRPNIAAAERERALLLDAIEKSRAAGKK